MKKALLVLVASCLMAGSPLSGHGQEDFRAAELDRPVRVEDAIPIKFREWEIELGSRGTLRAGARAAHGLLELKTGLFRNTQFGVEVEAAVESVGGARAESGIEAASAHLLYGVRRESVSMPALALRLEASTPGIGVVGREEAQLGLKGIMTRSFGRTRVHVNGGFTAADLADGGDFWQIGLGTDYPLGLFSRAVLADIYVEKPTGQGASRVWIDVGARLQITNWSVIDIGLSTRVDQWREGDANIELVLGLSRAFGLSGSPPPYPDPSIR